MKARITPVKPPIRRKINGVKRHAKKSPSRGRYERDRVVIIAALVILFGLVAAINWRLIP
jgi:hypothetical protein